MVGEYEPEVDESSAEERAGYWQAGIGLQQVDGLSVSKELDELASANINGLIGYDAVEQTVIDNYRGLDFSNADVRGGLEADLVATRIARLLSKNDFVLSVATLQSIHRTLFKGLELFERSLDPGIFKSQNWQKSEPILYGQSVVYGSADAVEANLVEAINAERAYAYLMPLNYTSIQHAAAFCAQIWQIHPFSEGNTRAIAVFVEKHLRAMGCHVDNSLFEQHSAYFRDALVRRCYMNAEKAVQREPLHLERFFDNLLLGGQNKLTFVELYVDALK